MSDREASPPKEEAPKEEAPKEEAPPAAEEGGAAEAPKDPAGEEDGTHEEDRRKKRSRKSSRDRDRDRDRSRRDRDDDSSRKKKKKRSRDRSRDKDRDRRKKHRRSRSRSGSRSRKSARAPSPPRMSDADLMEQKRKDLERDANRGLYTVFVSQIHPKVDERDLFEFFSIVGVVEDIRLIKDQRTNKSKGLCYVEFRERADVNKAVALTGQLLGGYPITIQITETGVAAEPPVRLLVNNLHPNVTADDLRPVFEAFGTLDSITIEKDPSGTSKGFGYVQYQKESEGKQALPALDGLNIAGTSIAVQLAENNPMAYTAMDTGVQTLEMDDTGAGGMAMTAENRQVLMQRLSRGAAMPGIVSAPPMPAAPHMPVNTGVIAAAKLNVPLIQPSTCVVVKNMFDPKTETEPDFDLDVKEDVEEEATKLGARLEHVHVDKTNPQGVVYLRFADIPSATKIATAFHGRWFASRQISAEYVIEATYLMKFPRRK